MALLSTILSAVMRKGILVAVVLLAIFLVVEAVLWVTAPISPYLAYRFELKNDMEVFGLPNATTFEVDSREIRHREPAEGRDREVTVLVVGGEGSYEPLQEVEQTWWGQAAENLEARFPEVGIRVGVKANPPTRLEMDTSMRHALRWAKAYVPEIEPDILVVSFGISEVLDIPSDYRYEPGALDQLAPLDRGNALKERVVGVSQIARRLRRWRASGSELVQQRRAMLEQRNLLLKSMGQQRALYEGMRFDSGHPERAGESAKDPLQEYLEGLGQFRELAGRTGAQLVVLGEPCLHDDLLGAAEVVRLKRPRWVQRPTAESPEGFGLRPDPGWVKRELDRYYAAASEWAEVVGVSFLNLNQDQVVPKTTRYFVDDATLTGVGSRRVAEVATPELVSVMEKILAN